VLNGDEGRFHGSQARRGPGGDRHRRARGIGRAVSLRFAKEGASVAILDILDEAEMVAVDIRAFSGHAIFLKVDLTDQAPVRAGVAGAAKVLGGKIDVLVNNAAIPGVNKLSHEIEVEEWGRVFDLNVKGTFLITKYTLPYMTARKSSRSSILLDLRPGRQQ
jgi:NAD(P)-dependent dehydrogenase (short-subunit alcohol dehydrogenase family)